MNVEKPKIVVFKKGCKLKKKINWMYDNKYFYVVDNFKYLGMSFNFNDNFHKTHHVLIYRVKKVYVV